MKSHPRRYAVRNRAFLLGILLNTAFIIVEAAYGFLADALALIADAGHNFGDVIGLMLAWGGAFLARRHRTPRRTYGFRRTTIYAALLNAIILFLSVGAIGAEAVRRLLHPLPAAGTTMVVVALIGVVVNSATALLFMAGRRHDLNIRGAFLHMAADAAVSAGGGAAGVGIVFTGWRWLDPAVSLVIAAVILIGTWGLMRDAMNLALDAVPGGIDPTEIRSYLENLPGVIEVHDLHIWAMSTTETALTAHLVQDGSVDPHQVTAEARRQINKQFGIGHSTLQWEKPSSRGEGDSVCLVDCACEYRKRVSA
jgi:cobalt-zinc-cadmium efflux system protein